MLRYPPRPGSEWQRTRVRVADQLRVHNLILRLTLEAPKPFLEHNHAEQDLVVIPSTIRMFSIELLYRSWPEISVYGGTIVSEYAGHRSPERIAEPAIHNVYGKATLWTAND